MGSKASSVTTETPSTVTFTASEEQKWTREAVTVLTLNVTPGTEFPCSITPTQPSETAAVFFQEVISSVRLYSLPTHHPSCRTFSGSHFYELSGAVVNVPSFPPLTFTVQI
ncbi:hypothetical protein PAL_GLEAN10000673 [Pteropus alecto]|uniref:Uncharacterized protein n=1 Tax=Pteropus alecto TaxID=9402 RepID=L5L515_PTEAL|nr:hypothetical protein PAL_GLEAN10000673 [Pteropus alecto]